MLFNIIKSDDIHQNTMMWCQEWTKIIRYIRNFITSDQKNETDFLIYKNKFVKILIAVTE